MAITVNLYLDSRFAKRTNQPEELEVPIKITITKDGATAYLPTGLKILPSQWKERHIIGRKDKARLNDYLDSFKSRVRVLIREGLEEERYQFMCATEIKNDISRRMGKAEGGRSRSTLFFSVYDTFAETRTSERTKEIYRVTGRKIRQLLPKPERIRIDQIDLDWLENLDELLVLKGNNGTTRNIDFRNIRAVLRYAQKHKLLRENPFDDFIMPVGDSPNRALTAEQLRTLINAEVKPWERKYLDFFLLSFLLIGMNTEDILHIERIEDGRINYVRAKTHKEMSVKVGEIALSIIDKYKGMRRDAYSTSPPDSSRAKAVSSSHTSEMRLK